MKIRFHLISAPWSASDRPSAALGCLKAHLDTAFGDDKRVDVRVYSAHLSILYGLRQGLAHHFYANFRKNGEFPYLLLFYRRYLASAAERKSGARFKKFCAEICRLDRISESDPPDEATLLALEQATVSYLEERVMPQLSRDAVNIVGLSLNYYQLYSSLFIQRYLRERAAGKRLLFIYGGYEASSPNGIRVLRDFAAPGYRFIGEGEKKLELFARNLLEGRAPEAGVPGVYALDAPKSPLEIGDADFSTQFKDLASLPLPDYDEYFDEVRALEKGDPMFRKIGRYTLTVEGTRGCFAHCDFCTLNSQWRGFRKLPAELVLERTLKLVERYSISRVQFLDNVCNTWAEKFADLVLERGVKLSFFMSLRAHHPERFWTKLALAGLEATQVGVEAVAPALLKKIGKGTRVIQNLVAQKCLQEMGVYSASNVITHHPKSTLEDVAESRRILKATPHFPQLFEIPFWFDAHSPIFESLTPEEKLSLRPYSAVRFEGELKGLSGDYGFEMPPRLRLSKGTQRAWDQFTSWYRRTYSKTLARGPRLTVRRLRGGTLLIEDTRTTKKRKIRLAGDEARLLTACHSGPRRETLIELGWEPRKLDRLLRSLLKRQLVLEVDGYYLALPLRPRKELVAGLRC